jgi:hypothetical protein
VRSAPTVIGALRRFLPEFLTTNPVLSPPQRRALWAINHCRTAALGGRFLGCQPCGQIHFAYHSCNHKACPQCGKSATAAWVQRELAKRVNAPYFMVTFTLPAQLRECFFGPLAKEAYDLFFAAVSGALAEKLATDKGLRAHLNGFTAVLHTWNQRLGFHPHIHCLVPGAGLNDRGRPVRVKKADFLIYQAHLQAAFRQHLGRLLAEHGWQTHPDAWGRKWGVHIKGVGSGVAAVKYLGAYVARTAISDRRVMNVQDHGVTFWWKDRSDGNRRKIRTVPGVEFVRSYLRHVLPKGLRSIRYYGFCHPAARAKRLRVQFHTGMAMLVGGQAGPPQPTRPVCCPQCGQPMRLILDLSRRGVQRGPPGHGPRQHQLHKAS